MKYTLFAFHLHPGELHEPGMQKTDLNEFGQMLAETATHRVDICEGVYVFETKKGWRDMHRLRVRLVHIKREYVELPFEETLAGFFSPSAVEKLRALGDSNDGGISLLNLNTE
jgi:hypothetical protein